VEKNKSFFEKLISYFKMNPKKEKEDSKNVCNDKNKENNEKKYYKCC
jgi:hypothetical protein